MALGGYWIARVSPGDDTQLQTCAPTSSTSTCRPTASRCGRRRRAMRRGCWWCGRAARWRIAGVRDLPDLLRAGDALVVNDTKVIPARLTGRRIGRGAEAAIEATLIKRLDGSRWRAFVRPAQEARARRHRPLRRRGQGLLPRPARRDGGGERRGRRGDARVRVPRAGARPGDRGARRHAAAALYRLASARPTSTTAPTTRRCSRATKARSRRRPPGCISPTICWRGSKATRHRRCTR